MLEFEDAKLSTDLVDVTADVPVEVWIGPIADAFDDLQIVRLRAVSKSLHTVMSHEH